MQGTRISRSESFNSVVVISEFSWQHPVLSGVYQTTKMLNAVRRSAGQIVRGRYLTDVSFDPASTSVLPSPMLSFLLRRRNYATKQANDGETRIMQLLQKNFPGIAELEVNDVSGGCGSMYQVYIAAEEFRGKRLVEQQRMVNKVLEQEIKEMHGISLQTAVPTKKKSSQDETPVSFKPRQQPNMQE